MVGLPLVVSGAGARRRLPQLIRECGWNRAFLVSTPGRSGDAANLRALLGDQWAGAHEGARVHVPGATVRAARAALDAAGADVLVALGGGSAIGLGKALALDTSLPLAAIPTTYSGSEMTAIFGVTDGDAKRTGRDPRARPVLVIYDPELTYGLPPRTTGGSALNAIAHGVEALYAPGVSPETAGDAVAGLTAMRRALAALRTVPDDPAGRATALQAAQLLGRALDAAAMGLHHKLAHVLGGTFGLPHAETHAVLLPHVIEFNAAAAPRTVRRAGEALGGDAAQTARAIAAQFDVPATLSELGFTAADIPRAAALAVQGAYPNPRPVAEGDVRALLDRALAGAAA